MTYTVEYWKRISFNEKDVFWEEVEANSEEEAIQYINDNIRWVIPKHTKIMKLEDIYKPKTFKDVLSQYNNNKNIVSDFPYNQGLIETPEQKRIRELEVKFKELQEKIYIEGVAKCIDKDYYRTQIQNEPLPPIKEKQIYSYTDQERGYSEYVMVEDDVRFKYPETGEWIEAVFYENETGKYVREKKDFYNKFKRK